MLALVKWYGKMEQNEGKMKEKTEERWRKNGGKMEKKWRNYGVQDEKYQNIFKVNKIEHNVYINENHFKDKIN